MGQLGSISITDSKKQRLVFKSRRIENSADWQIYLMNDDGDDQKLIDTTRVEYYGIEVAPDEGIISFLSREGSNIYLSTIKSDGTGLTRLVSADSYFSGVCWSPDKDKLIYIRNKTGTNDPILCLYNRLSGTESILINKGSIRSPQWITNEQIIIVLDDSNGMGRVLRFDINRGNKVWLTPNYLAIRDIRISPDKTLIACVSNDWSGSQIYVAKANGQDLTQITTGVEPGYWDIGKQRHGNDRPAWSPDSKYLTYVSWVDGDAEIYVCDIAGNKRQLTFNEDQDEFPIWALDGSKIFFDSNQGRFDGRGWQIFVIGVNGGPPQNIVNEIWDSVGAIPIP